MRSIDGRHACNAQNALDHAQHNPLNEKTYNCKAFGVLCFGKPKTQRIKRQSEKQSESED